MYVRRCVALAALLITTLGALAPASGAGSISVYFDSGFTKTELTDLERGSPVVFRVVAEDIDAEGLAGFTFGVEIGPSTLVLGITTTAGAAVPVTPLTAGNTRYETYTSPGTCLTPDAEGRVQLAEGILIWLGPGPGGETIIDVDAAVRLDNTRNDPTWFRCSNGSRVNFTTVNDGRIGPSGGPECVLTSLVVEFGHVALGQTVARQVAISNDGGGVLSGSIAAGCDQVTVTGGAGPFDLSFGESRSITLELVATTPGPMFCTIPTGTGCGDIVVQADVIDPFAIGDPEGTLAVYLDAALTQRVAVNQVFGTSHTFYVTAENLPPGAIIRGYEVALELDDFIPTAPYFNPPGSEIINGAITDYIVDRITCLPKNAAGKDLLFKVSAPMVIPSDDYTATVAATGSSLSGLGLGAVPVWEDCDGELHPFAEVKGARIEFIDPNECVRGPGTIDFGRVFTGDARTQTFTVTNTGTQPAVGILTVDCSAFTIIAGAEYDLAPQESHPVTVRFAPMGTGEYGCALAGGPMCNAVLMSGRGSAPRTVGVSDATVAVYFGAGFWQTQLKPEPGLFGSLFVVAEDFGVPLSGLDGFEVALDVPSDLLIVGGAPYPHNVVYDPGDGTQTVTLLVDMAACRATDAGGRVVLAELQYLYLPLFPSDGPATIEATAVSGSLFDPPAPGWTECGGDAHPFAVSQPAVVLGWTSPAPAAPLIFTRHNEAAAVSLNWDPQADASSWRIFRGDTPDFRPGRANLIAQVSTTSYGENLSDPARYYYKLSAVDAAGVGGPAIATTGEVVAVAFTAFEARATATGVDLEWDVFADEAFAGFRIYRARDGGLAHMISDALPVHERYFTDSGIAPGASYSYTVAAIMRDGTETRSLPARVSIGPAVTALLGNFPNPFNPVTTVAFSLERAARVRVQVFDAAGRLVSTLADGNFPAGTSRIEWDGRNRAGTPSASGVYFLRFDTPGARQTRKMVLLK